MATARTRFATDADVPEPDEKVIGGGPGWRSLNRIAGAASVAVVALLPVQMAIFFIWPPPSTAGGYFAQFHDNAVIGLLNQDLLLIVDEFLLILVMVALYVALRGASRSYAAIALALGLVGTALFLASNTAFNMLTLSNQYAAATSDEQRSMFLAAGEATLAAYQGTAFIAGYVLTAIADLLFAILMLRSTVFGKVAAYVGIVYGIAALVPPTAGTVGMAFALLSILPMAVWLILIARGLFRLDRPTAADRAASKAQPARPGLAWTMASRLLRF